MESSEFFTELQRELQLAKLYYILSSMEQSGIKTPSSSECEVALERHPTSLRKAIQGIELERSIHSKKGGLFMTLLRKIGLGG